jgi:phosphinothricin acetyltransferase
MEENIKFRPCQSNDSDGVPEVFSIFAKDSFAAYCDPGFDVPKFRAIIEQAKIILVLTDKESVIRFGFISDYKPYNNFSHTGVLTYFILTEYTGEGLGTKLFNN